MTDYLLTQYNDKIESALRAKEEAIAAATRLWNDACAEIIARWQGEDAAAAIELTTAMDHRNRVYVLGPPVEPEKPENTEPESPAPEELPTPTPAYFVVSVADGYSRPVEETKEMAE